MKEDQRHGLRSALAQLVAQTIEETTGQRVSLREDDLLIRGGFLDSLSTVNLVLALQTIYGFEIDVMEIDEDNFGSVARLAALVERRARSVAREDGSP